MMSIALCYSFILECTYIILNLILSGLFIGLLKLQTGILYKERSRMYEKSLIDLDLVRINFLIRIE